MKRYALTAREEEIIARRDRGESYAAIGVALGLTGERIRQIERRAREIAREIEQRKRHTPENQP